VIDGTVQGSMVRLLMAKGSPLPEQGPLSHLNIAASVAVPSRLEDSFVDALGGARIGPSMLAAQYKRYDATDPEPSILAQSLSKKYGRFTAADAISFSVQRGEIFGLLGPNGAGKSTTFKMLCGLVSATGGTGRVNGYDLRSAKAEARQSLGYMAQRFSLYADLTVLQNLRFFAGAYGLAGQRQRDAVDHVSQIFDLGRFHRVDAGTLPMGYKQRLSLACAVMHQPPVLFLDEPTSGVDPLVRREFWSHINGMAERGVTIFVTTHFMDEAEYCDRIAIIFRGQTIALGSPQALKASVRTPDQADPTLEQAFVALVSQHQSQKLGAAPR
jgi:ABC-2 type transport system ATP-binding protein